MLCADVVFYRDWLVIEAASGLLVKDIRFGGIAAREIGRIDE
jgi:hypothetical protein